MPLRGLPNLSRSVTCGCWANGVPPNADELGGVVKVSEDAAPATSVRVPALPLTPAVPPTVIEPLVGECVDGTTLSPLNTIVQGAVLGAPEMVTVATPVGDPEYEIAEAVTPHPEVTIGAVVLDDAAYWKPLGSVSVMVPLVAMSPAADSIMLGPPRVVAVLVPSVAFVSAEIAVPPVAGVIETPPAATPESGISVAKRAAVAARPRRRPSLPSGRTGADMLRTSCTRTSATVVAPLHRSSVAPHARPVAPHARPAEGTVARSRWPR